MGGGKSGLRKVGRERQQGGKERGKKRKGKEQAARETVEAPGK